MLYKFVYKYPPKIILNAMEIGFKSEQNMRFACTNCLKITNCYLIVVSANIELNFLHEMWETRKNVFFCPNG